MLEPFDSITETAGCKAQSSKTADVYAPWRRDGCRFSSPMAAPQLAKLDRLPLVGLAISILLHLALIWGMLLELRRSDGAAYAPQGQTVEVSLVSMPNVVQPKGPQSAAEGAKPMSRSPQLAGPSSVSKSTSVGTPSAGSAESAPGIDGLPPMAVGSSPTVDDTGRQEAAADAYRRLLLQHIAGFRRPAADGVHGTVMICFSLSRDGKVTTVSVARGSGVADLDDEATATIWRAQPMPVIPSALPDHLAVMLPVTFSDRDRTPG